MQAEAYCTWLMNKCKRDLCAAEYFPVTTYAGEELGEHIIHHGEIFGNILFPGTD